MSAVPTAAGADQLIPEPAQAADWRALLQALPDPAWLVALPALTVLEVNDAATAFLGRARDDLLACRADQLLDSPEDRAFWEQAADGPFEPLDSETLLPSASGAGLPVRRRIRALAGPGALAPAQLLVTLQDRGALFELQSRFDDTLAELNAALEAVADGLLVTDLAGRIRGFNHRFAEIWRLPDELTGSRRDDAVRDWMRRSVHDSPGYQNRLLALDEAPLLNATDRVRLLSGQVLERVARPLLSRGRRLGRVYTFRDLTERRQADAPVDALARTDELTGLPNRHHLSEQLTELALAMRHDGDGFTLMLVDLDRFRRINDSLGHAQGDRVLRETAERIGHCLRQGDLLARVGGDQFALLLRHTDAAAAEAAAQRIIGAVARPWQSDGLPYKLSCSIGIALCPGHGRDADELLCHAEAAVQAAKQAGGHGLRFHQRRAGLDLRQHMQIDQAMRLSLAGNRFRLHYQPLVTMDGERIVGAEALLRWRDPSLGELAPAQFISVAEDTGFITTLGAWVLDQAARQAADWQRAGRGVPVAVNVSGLQFRHPHFVDRVAAALRDHGPAPNLLSLELTEAVLGLDSGESLQRLQALQRLGVRLAIDDFGTGFSSLACLQRFPVDRLKIDHSFVKGLPGDEASAAVVRAIIQTARALGHQVVAEGVETEAQRRVLAEAGCDLFQGFLVAPAIDALSFAARLAAPAPPPPAPRCAVVHHLPRR